MSVDATPGCNDMEAECIVTDRTMSSAALRAAELLGGCINLHNISPVHSGPDAGPALTTPCTHLKQPTSLGSPCTQPDPQVFVQKLAKTLTKHVESLREDITWSQCGLDNAHVRYSNLVKPKRQPKPDRAQSKPGRSSPGTRATAFWTRAEVARSAPQILTIVGLAFELAMSPNHFTPKSGVARPIDKLLAFVRGIWYRQSCYKMPETQLTIHVVMKHLIG